MTADRRVRYIRKTQFAKQAALFFLRLFAQGRNRQEAIERQFERLGACDFRLERATDNRRSGSEHVDLDAYAMRIAEQYFLGRRTLPPQSAALPDGKLLAEFRFGEPGEREVEVVATEQQMLAHGSARKI